MAFTYSLSVTEKGDMAALHVTASEQHVAMAEVSISEIEIGHCRVSIREIEE